MTFSVGILLVAVLAAGVAGCVLGFFYGVDIAVKSAARERLKASARRAEYEPAAESPRAMPTRQEVRRAAESNAKDAVAARYWLCHDPGCAGQGKHRCHNLDCKPHASALPNPGIVIP